MEFITNKIHEIFPIVLSKENIINYKLNIENVSNDGAGCIGRILRVRVTGEQNNQNFEPVTLSFICKYLPIDLYEREKFNSLKCFEREVYVYNHVLPEYEKIQKQYNINDNVDGFYSYPKCYYATFDGDNNFSIIVLQDLMDSDYDVYATHEKLVMDVNQVKLAMKVLGRFHAVAFALEFHRSDIMKKFKTLDNILAKALSTTQLVPIAVRNSKLAIETCGTLNENYLLLLKEFSPYVWDQIGEMSDSKLSAPYNVLCHGDCYINNMMFTQSVSCNVIF